jgi:membrane protease YdiL (CAAX protease family)
MFRRAKERISKHPIQAFVLLGTIFGFVTMFPALLFIPQDSDLGQLLSFYLARVGTYSPVLTGMFIARVIKPNRQKVSLSRRLLVFLPLWVVAEIVHVTSLSLSVPPDTPLILLVILSLPVALLPAYVISSAYLGSTGVKQMLATLVRPRGNIVFYLFALSVFPLTHIVGFGITNALNGKAWFPQVSQGTDLAITVAVTFFSVLLFSGGINEESGWRGFVQHRLQARYSPLIAILILWFITVIWHIPNDIVQYKDGGYLLIRIALGPFIMILFGWVYNRTDGSILAPAIFHASMNSMNPVIHIIPNTPASSMLMIGLAVTVIVSDQMWRRLSGDHPAVYQDGMTSDDTASSV